ncbi:MAG: ferritin family protein [Nitrospira sp.]|nr:ferritin family protein [Nitrospira sp.]
MTDFSVQEVLEMAIQTEKLGAEFYTNMAEMFKDNEEFKTLFELLAEKEIAHENVFHSIMEKMGSKYQMPDNWGEVKKYLRAIIESEFFLGDNKVLPNYSHLRTANDVINYALTFEKVTLLYYLELRDIVNNTDAINYIINEEKGHIVWLSGYRKQLMG